MLLGSGVQAEIHAADQAAIPNTSQQQVASAGGTIDSSAQIVADGDVRDTIIGRNNVAIRTIIVGRRLARSPHLGSGGHNRVQRWSSRDTIPRWYCSAIRVVGKRLFSAT